MLQLGRFVTVRSPVDMASLDQSLSGVQRLQFDEPLQDHEYEGIADALDRNPHVTLRVYGFSEELAGLEFLRWFPRLKRFSLAGLHHVAGLEKLSYLPENLTALDLGETRSSLDLRPAARFQGLRELRVVGHKKGLSELLDGNPDLRALALWRLPLDRAIPALRLPGLDSLALSLGSVERTSWLADIGDPRYLAVRDVRGVEDLNWVEQFVNLECLWLDGLRKVTRLPDFSRNQSLARIDLTGMRGLRDSASLEPLARAPRLQELVVSDSHIDPEAFIPIAERSEIRRVGVGLGSARRNRQAASILGREEPQSLDNFATARGIVPVV